MFMPPTSHVTMPVLLIMKVLPESPELPGRIEGLGRAGQAVFILLGRSTLQLRSLFRLPGMQQSSRLRIRVLGLTV